MSDNKNGEKHSSDRVSREFTALSFLWRLLFSLALVLITYNPSGTSFYHWLTDAISNSALDAVHFFIAALLLIGWAILWAATWRSLETIGVLLATAAIAALVWLLIDIGLLDPKTSSAVAWIVLVSLGLLLAIGLSWSHIWRRMTGQFDVDDDD